jgi:RNA polymerase sigma factor (sigma-70 family)
MPHIPYKLADGKTVELDVSAEVAEQFTVFRRQNDSAQRKARRHKELSLDGLNERTGYEPPDKSVNIETDYIKRERGEELARAIKRLNDRQREIIQLHFYEDKPLVEIAQLLGVSKSAITQQFAVIYKNLKKFLSEP